MMSGKRNLCRLIILSGSSLLALIFLFFFNLRAQAKTLASDTSSPVINIWYGPYQIFGRQGSPQEWINILGNVSDPESGIQSLIYALNGVQSGSSLSIGPDDRRLVNPGDFNIELDKDTLLDGLNTIVIMATNNEGLQQSETVTVEYHKKNIWNIPYFIDWSSVIFAQEVIQIVDGLWTWDANGIRTVQTGYDRIIAIGDMSWDDYEVLVPISIHSFDPEGGVGIVIRWLGHTDDPVICVQPHCGWLPQGGSNWFDWQQDQPDILKLIANPPDGFDSTTSIQMLAGHTYWFRARVETNQQGSLYRLKVWEDNVENEPSEWTLQRQTIIGNLEKGSFLFVAHHVDATLGDVIATSLSTAEYTLSVNPIGGGSVTVEPEQLIYHYGEVVTLTAIPDPGWSFVSWGEALSGSVNPINLTITGDLSVTANFTQDEFTLTLDTQGSGSVIAEPEQSTYHYGDIVTLTAIPDLGWFFASWGDELSGYTNPETLTITGDHSVTANFTQDEFTLTLDTEGSGSVTVWPDPSTYHYGDIVTLTALPDSGWIFTTWDSDLTGSANPETLKITRDHLVTAKFSQSEYILTVNAVGGGSVSVEPEQASYYYGDVVTFTAIADPDWIFSSWSGDLTGSTNPNTIKITGDHSITATFTQDEYTLTINIIGSGSVSVEPEQSIYHYGDLITLTALPNPGWTFSSWSSDLVGSNFTIQIMILKNINVTAIFNSNLINMPLVIHR